jgi:hypothetical protein
MKRQKTPLKLQNHKIRSLGSSERPESHLFGVGPGLEGLESGQLAGCRDFIDYHKLLN